MATNQQSSPTNKRLHIPPRPAWRVMDDIEQQGFVYDSVVRRLAGIVAKLQGEFPALAQVSASLRDGTWQIKPITHHEDGGPDWTTYVHAEQERLGCENLTAFTCGWFFLENYTYRMIAHHVQYFVTGLDPFAKDKAQALTTAAPVMLAIRNNNEQETFMSLVHMALWGNKADLSLSVGVVSEKDSKASRGELLVDDCEKCWHDLKLIKTVKDSVRVCIVLDNCGIELLSDLQVASFLVQHGYTVELHCKAYPVFVSDAIENDVKEHLTWLWSHDMCRNLQNNSKFTYKAFEFYCSPQFFDELVGPNDDIVATTWTDCDLVIVKGDANYRRLVRDCHRDMVATPFGEAIGIKTANVLAIRTCKSPVAVGLDDNMIKNIAAKNKNWCLDGSCGVIQYFKRA